MTALPPSLDRFGGELEDAVGLDLGHRRRRRRAVRGAVVLAVAGAAALGLLSGLPAAGRRWSNAPQRPSSPRTPGSSITRSTRSSRTGTGASASLHQETWQLLVAPYTRRQIAIDGTDGIRAESVSGRHERALRREQRARSTSRRARSFARRGCPRSRSSPRASSRSSPGALR